MKNDEKEDNKVTNVERLVMRLDEIRERLNKTTKSGPWKAVKCGSPVLKPDLSKPGNPYYSRAEDDCILDKNDEEVLGCSEWMRVEWNDLEFMARAKSDIEFLVVEFEKLLMIL